MKANFSKLSSIVVHDLLQWGWRRKAGLGKIREETHTMSITIMITKSNTKTKTKTKMANVKGRKGWRDCRDAWRGRR